MISESVVTSNLDSPLLDWVNQRLRGDFKDLGLLVSRVEALPGLSKWVPNNQSSVFEILGLGVELGGITGGSFVPLLSEISKDLRETGRVARDHIAELNAAALISRWVDGVIYCERSNRARSPDLQARVAEVVVDIEVTAAERKEEQASRGDVAAVLEGKLKACRLDSHISVHFLDPLTDDMEREILEAASTLPVGQSTEKIDFWRVQVDHPHRDGVFEGARAEPEWWPAQHATPVRLGTSFSGIGTAEAKYSSAEVRWGLSTRSYINSVGKKAERHQGSQANAYVIALDATTLPGAIRWYEENLRDYWPLWDNVSAVLVFQRATLGLEASWCNYKMLANPHAMRPVPSLLLERGGSGTWIEYF